MLTISALTHAWTRTDRSSSLFTFHRLKIECEKLASEKTEMQRHYVMVRHFVSSFSRLFNLLTTRFIYIYIHWFVEKIACLESFSDWPLIFVRIALYNNNNNFKRTTNKTIESRGERRFFFAARKRFWISWTTTKFRKSRQKYSSTLRAMHVLVLWNYR